MRAIWRRRIAVSAAMFLTIGLLMTTASAGILRCPDYLILEGEIVEIGDTTITIHEWAGVYTYRLDSTERWKLQSSGIGPGDKVQFLSCSDGRFAKDFKKL